MNASRSPKLDLQDQERANLRRARIRLAEIADLDAESLALILDCSRERARDLVFSATVQRFDSVGPATVDDLFALNIRDSATLAAAEPVELYHRLNRLAGRMLDPCVEDQLRTTVAQARWPDLAPPQRPWWAWMGQRGEVLTRP